MEGHVVVLHPGRATVLPPPLPSRRSLPWRRPPPELPHRRRSAAAPHAAASHGAATAATAAWWRIVVTTTRRRRGGNSSNGCRGASSRPRNGDAGRVFPGVGLLQLQDAPAGHPTIGVKPSGAGVGLRRLRSWRPVLDTIEEAP